MALDVLRYINLASANHRDKAFLKQIRSMVDIPNVQMERFEAHDGSQYPSRHALIDAAAREFPFFSKLKESPYWSIGRGMLGAMWSYLSCLQLAVARNETSLILYDDRPLGRPLSELAPILEVLENDTRDSFRILQLTWFSTEICISNNPVYQHPLCSEICHSFSSTGDCHCVYSPAGAQWLIDVFAAFPHPFEWIFNHFSDVCIAGMYSSRQIDRDCGWEHYIHYDIQERSLIDALDEEIPVPEGYREKR